MQYVPKSPSGGLSKLATQNVSATDALMVICKKLEIIIKQNNEAYDMDFKEQDLED